MSSMPVTRSSRSRQAVAAGGAVAIAALLGVVTSCGSGQGSAAPAPSTSISSSATTTPSVTASPSPTTTKPAPKPSTAPPAPKPTASKPSAPATSKPATPTSQPKPTTPTVVKTTRIEAVPFKTVYRNDATMAKGTSKVIQAGVNGSREVTYVNGAISSTRLIKAPVSKIVAVGTYVKPVAKRKATVALLNKWSDASGAYCKYQVNDPDGVGYTIGIKVNGLLIYTDSDNVSQPYTAGTAPRPDGSVTCSVSFSSN